MRAPQFWQNNRRGWAVILHPLGVLYAWLVWLRRIFTRPKKLAVPVICIGNFTLGGAGKTPTIELCARLLRAAGHKPAILSRGFGGRLKEAIQVLPTHKARDVGDEPFLLAQDNPVYIGADRAKSGALAIAAGYDILLKDDGFQNPALSHDKNLLVIDGARGLGNGLVFPAGPLRELLGHAVKRMDGLLIIGTAQHTSVKHLIDDCARSNIPCFFGAVKVCNPQPKKVFAFSGIAYPQKFYDSLNECGYEIIGTHDFPDHYFFSEADAHMILQKTGDSIPITTAKDRVRLLHTAQGSYSARLAQCVEVLDIELMLADEAHFISFLTKF